MGTFLASYGDDGYDHEGYVAQVLDDGTLTGTYSNETTPRMVGQVVAACGCGWTGSTRYPSPGPFDETAKGLALDEWEHTHARPTLDGLRTDKWDRLRTLVRKLAESHALITRSRFADLTPRAQRDLLDRTLASLDRARELVHQLRTPLDTPRRGEQL
ncbi:MAG: hypothetical protein LC749_15360 [Actinobacteria bacterium]|nr:hypothetical protein [Actinomycetota bacterium]